jgi:hypothetical protein
MRFCSGSGYTVQRAKEGVLDETLGIMRPGSILQ